MEFDNLHQILRSLYEQMMPLCGDMAGVAKGIAGLGALFYVAYRVWQSLARAEPVSYTHLDVYKRQGISRRFGSQHRSSERLSDFGGKARPDVYKRQLGRR